MKSRYNITRKVLIGWGFFIGIGALVGGICMLIKPDGSLLQMQSLIEFFQVLPFAELLFQDYFFPGIALLCVNCIPNLIAAWLLIRGKKSGIICGGIFGITLMAWIVIQFIIFPPNFLSISYFIFGFLQALTGLMCYIFYEQESFVVDESAYKNIGTDKKRLVVYFSRMGYVKKAALEEANRVGAVLFEIKATERTEGTLGFWWCGRFAMHRMEMPIAEIPAIEEFEHITICSPIWVFNLSAPVRTFCVKASGRVRAVDYILVHHQKSHYENAAAEMDNLLGIRGNRLVSICCRRGKVISKQLIER